MEKIKPYTVELVLILCSTLLTGASIYLHLQNRTFSANDVLCLETDSSTKRNQEILKSKKMDKLYIDVSGAVVSPDLYEATPGSRLKDVIDIAGGLSDEADKLYIARNFNLSRFVTDQEKIYIPTTFDISTGMFTEISTAMSTQNNSTTTEIASSTNLISINDAGMDELDTLPGIGPVTAQKIIDGRPYSTPEEVLSKKILNSSTWEKIKDLVRL